MKRFLRLLLSGVGLLLGAKPALAATTLELHQELTTYNLQSIRGVPISTTTNNPPGSDGRMPTVNESAGSVNPPTASQFQGFLSFGGVATPGDWQSLNNYADLTNGTSPFSAAVAVEMQLPLAYATPGDKSSPVVMILRRAQVGSPFVSRQVSFAFGSEIASPGTDEKGILLSGGVTNTDYWLSQPYFTTNFSDLAQGFYWSPNAQKVFAIQSGPIFVTWVRATNFTSATLPAYTNLNGTLSFVTNGGNVLLLYTARYLVSASAVKTPQKMYWTEPPFNNSGQLVNVPQGAVAAVNVVYNNNFPQTAPRLYVDPFTPPQVNPTNSLQEPRTLWFQNNVIHAFNVEGRVFVELLGEPNPDQSRRFLGFEVVDVYKEPLPTDITVELGERVPGYQDGRDDSGLYPSPLLNTPQKFYYRQTQANSDRGTLYATYATANVNDFQSYWLIPGVAGLRWPYLFNRYHEVWPADPAKYVHYLRALVPTEAEAKATAVQLPGTEAPQILCQDLFPAPLGAKLSTDGRFYTFIDLQHPAHRTLLQFNVGDQVAFQRVFSWLDRGIQDNGQALASGGTNFNSILQNSLVTTLDAWDPARRILTFNPGFAVPYYARGTVNVGDELRPPEGELGATGDYWAGYILQTNGNSFNPRAYLDPFAVGFDQANQGAIIPVNTIPGRDALDVWWFRRDQADLARGFQPSYWPTVLGHYQLQWAPNADEIILASNDGSGPLDSLQAKGTIYRQANSALPGYNPNEEHALLIGGQVYALRDDLNNTNPGPAYSSAPYVLLDYTGTDGRPAMRVFHVRREDPNNGIVFDYVVEAGKVLRAPMPLPLLEPPVVGTGGSARSLNTEAPETSGDLPVGWNNPPPDSPFGHYSRFTFEDRKHDIWVYRGLHAGLAALALGDYDTTNRIFKTLAPATAVRGKPFEYFLDVSRRLESLTVTVSNLPNGLTLQATNGLAIVGTPSLFANSALVTITLTARDTLKQVSASLQVDVVGDGIVAGRPRPIYQIREPFTHQITTFTNRIPLLAEGPTVTNCFTMQYYYKTQATFDWLSDPPPVGTIVPYLLPTDIAGRQFVGDPRFSNTASLKIVYRPEWPSVVNNHPLPALFSGETLTVPKRELAAVRDQNSVQVLYQQSIGLNFIPGDAARAVELFDPTVQKTASLTSLGGLPVSVIGQPYLGKVYFPNLPPNLKDRLFYDPNSTNLVFQGKFVDDPVGEKYLLLNVLRGADLEAAKAICSTNDQNRTDWEAALANLTTPVYTFSLDTNANFTVNTNLTVTRSTGDLVEITNADTAVDSYAMSATGPGIGYISYVVGNGHDPRHASEPVSVYILRVVPDLYPGELKVIHDSNPLSEQISFQHTSDLAGHSGSYEYDWRIVPPVDGQPPTTDPTNWTQFLAVGTDIAHYTWQGNAGIQALSDNYVSLRYRSIDPLATPASTNWSQWTGYPDKYALAEGWIKRVLGGIDPFNQRTSDLFNNPANTTASLISQAGARWEGDVALNQDTINKFGLIQIYETVLRRGEALSINGAGGGINYGPANDALLLASGYLNDLYMMLGNEASADAANPTVGFGTADKTYGNIATALFAFKGQMGSLLEEESALLRGRDDFLSPGVQLNPVYNRLYWNYTRGIASGEVVYALNYNILDQNNDGVVNAADAAILYPQGHGDGYGHYLTALKNYYSLLLNPKFDWVPRIETVSVLGAPVSVDFQDERKFAAAAAALARTGRQVFDLAWRQDYQPNTASGWSQFGAARVNSRHAFTDGGQTNYSTRYWGMDHWASRVGQGAFVNWIVGNAILPPSDPDPTHEGIQKVDRTTVPELSELPTTCQQLQTDMENAEAGFTPLGLPKSSIPFDINPAEVTGTSPKTHFEQVYERAVTTLNNAVVAFNDAQNVTQLMRSEEDSLFAFQIAYTNQEFAYNNQLIELYGTPYPDDIGPGKTYVQGFEGPDLFHYTYVENPDATTYNGLVPDPTINQTFYVDVQSLPANWQTEMLTNLNLVPSTDPNYTKTNYSIPFNIGANGFFSKPANWTSQRESPGKVQQAISELIAAQNRLRNVVVSETYDKQTLDKAMLAFQTQYAYESNSVYLQNLSADLQRDVNNLQEGYNVESKTASLIQGVAADFIQAMTIDVPFENIFGLANGGDQAKVGSALLIVGALTYKWGAMAADLATFIGTSAQTTVDQNRMLQITKDLNNAQLDQDVKNAVLDLGNQELNIQNDLFTINEALRSLDDAQRAYKALEAQGNRIQQERLTFRQHAAALIQGFRTRDAAFRIFKNEKLERYKTLFDLAAEYAFLAAQAYDYETGLLNTQQGQNFVNRIVSARALGVVQNGQPQYAGSDTGDPGLSSALAEMKADWDVLEGRLGFNNPDGYGTLVSLRNENYRILSGSLGDNNWVDVLQRGRVSDLLADPDAKRYCLQLDDGSGQPVPGLILTFSTTISDGFNLFGQPLVTGDHSFSSSSFATKIYSAGVDLEGYVGMDNPAPGNTSPPDPLDPNGLAATPYVYLIPTGADTMRSPPLGDTSTIRTWNVSDVAIPLPFNISASDFSTAPFYTAAGSLTEPLFGIRKSPSFRPVSTAAAFNNNIYFGDSLAPSEFTNRRLIGRSVWNSQWKLIIPGKTLLNDPNEGLNRFIRSVKDIKLFFVTYSYAGN